MAATMTGGPQRRGSSAGLSEEDVRALFALMAKVVYSGDTQEDVAFSGKLLATLFEAYSQHLIKLMREWPELSDALQSRDAVARAERLHERLKNLEPIDFKAAPRPYRFVSANQEPIARSLISGKGMEI
jgi:hypothetical protein